MIKEWSGRWESKIPLVRATLSKNHEVANAKGAACDYCVKNAVTPANASDLQRK
jgi:hypothetical protein